MNIEKVTFYKVAVMPSRSREHIPSQNIMAISLPRVRCLEADGPYLPAWAIPYKEPEPQKIEEPQKTRRRNTNGKRINRVNINMPLTALEQAVGELAMQGIEVRTIATQLKISPNSAKDAKHRFRLKKQLIPQPE